MLPWCNMYWHHNRTLPQQLSCRSLCGVGIRLQKRMMTFSWSECSLRMSFIDGYGQIVQPYVWVYGLDWSCTMPVQGGSRSWKSEQTFWRLYDACQLKLHVLTVDQCWSSVAQKMMFTIVLDLQLSSTLRHDCNTFRFTKLLQATRRF